MGHMDVDLDESDSITSHSITPSQKKLLLELGSKIADVAIDQCRAQKSSSNKNTLFAYSLWQSCFLLLPSSLLKSTTPQQLSLSERLSR